MDTRTGSVEKDLLHLNVTLNSMGVTSSHFVTLLASNDEEIKEKLEGWIKCTRRGSHLVSWEKQEYIRRERTEEKTDPRPYNRFKQKNRTWRDNYARKESRL